MKVVRTRQGARLLQGGAIVSEILRAPGATDTLFDVLAAAVAMFARGPRIAVLGFAGGGIVAPLRSMGCLHPLRCVDLSTEAERLFRELSSPWCGDVQLDEAEASAWLRARRGTWDLILEDLSVLGPEGETKPHVSVDVMPELVASRLSAHGVAVYNLLPVPGWSMSRLVRRVLRPHRGGIKVMLHDYENVLALAGPGLSDARSCSRLLARGLAGIDSEQRERLQLRTVSFAKGDRA